MTIIGPVLLLASTRIPNMFRSGKESDASGPKVFVTMHWSVVLAAGDGDSPPARGALEELCRAYWFPIHGYVRRKGHGVFDPGEVVFDKQAGVVVNDALMIRSRSVCKLARSHQIGDNAEVCVAGGGRFLLQGHAETIGSLCLTNNCGDTEPTHVDTGGATLSVQGIITAVNDAVDVVPTIRGMLRLAGPAPMAPDRPSTLPR